MPGGIEGTTGRLTDTVEGRPVPATWAQVWAGPRLDAVLEGTGRPLSGSQRQTRRGRATHGPLIFRTLVAIITRTARSTGMRVGRQTRSGDDVARTGTPLMVVEHLRAVDDAGSEQLEGINTSGWFIEAVNTGVLQLTGNIRPDWQPGQQAGTKTKRKIDRWAEELLANNAVIGNLSIRLDPTACEFALEPDEEGDLTLTLWSGNFDCAVDSLSRIKAILKAAASPVGTFDMSTRFATRIWVADNTLASRVGSDYNTRGDKVNDTAAKFAYQDTAEKRMARQLLTESRHLGIDNVEVLKNTVSGSSSKLFAFNTLAEAMEAFWTGEPINVSEEEEQVKFLVDFWDALVSVRREFGRLGKSDRQALRGSSMAGTALSIHGVIAVASEIYNKSLDPTSLLAPLGEPVKYGEEQVDYFSYDNPTWLRIGALSLSEDKTGNTRKTLRMSFQTRKAIAAELKRRVGLQSD